MAGRPRWPARVVVGVALAALLLSPAAQEPGTTRVASSAAADYTLPTSGAVGTVLRDLIRAQRLTPGLRLVLGPLPQGTLRSGTRLSARLTGLVSRSFALARPSSRRSELLGRGAATVVAGRTTRVVIALSPRARRALSDGRKLRGALTVRARRPDAVNTARQRVSIAPLHPPRCFGAAARDKWTRCTNPRLRQVIVPSPLEALLAPNADCTPIRTSVLYTCIFGPGEVTDLPTVALVGDSHASHWRAAVDFVARHEGRPAISLTHSGCPFSRGWREGSRRERLVCAAWNQQVAVWLRLHPEVRTVFVSNNAGAEFVDDAGRPSRASAIKGYLRALKSLPRSVTRVVVIRDIPRQLTRTTDCILRARARHVPAGTACAVPRGLVLREDPAVQAARRLRSARLQVADLTRFFCDLRLCFPVIGGVLVHKDATHMTELYSTTLGPYLLRSFERSGR